MIQILENFKMNALDAPRDFLATHYGSTLSVALMVYIIYVIFGRLYLSPIAHIPGPKLAALTRL